MTTRKTKKTSVKSDSVKVPEYTAIANVMGKKYTATGPSISEALAGLEIRSCKGKCILTVKHGEVSKDRILMPLMAYRLFSSHGLTREVSLKNVSNLFQGI